MHNAGAMRIMLFLWGARGGGVYYTITLRRNPQDSIGDYLGSYSTRELDSLAPMALNRIL